MKSQSHSQHDVEECHWQLGSVALQCGLGIVL